MSCPNRADALGQIVCLEGSDAAGTTERKALESSLESFLDRYLKAADHVIT